MRTAWRLLPMLFVMGLGPYAIARSHKATGSQKATESQQTSDAPQINACGCYRNSVGVCFCEKRGKCECPGEC